VLHRSGGFWRLNRPRHQTSEIQTTNFPVRIGGWHDRFSQSFRSTVIGVAATAGNVGNRQNSPQFEMKNTKAAARSLEGRSRAAFQIASAKLFGPRGKTVAFDGLTHSTHQILIEMQVVDRCQSSVDWFISEQQMPQI
jgi:hypothetical protein